MVAVSWLRWSWSVSDFLGGKKLCSFVRSTFWAYRPLSNACWNIFVNSINWQFYSLDIRQCFAIWRFVLLCRGCLFEKVFLRSALSRDRMFPLCFIDRTSFELQCWYSSKSLLIKEMAWIRQFNENSRAVSSLHIFSCLTSRYQYSCYVKEQPGSFLSSWSITHGDCTSMIVTLGSFCCLNFIYFINEKVRKYTVFIIHVAKVRETSF